MEKSLAAKNKKVRNHNYIADDLVFSIISKLPLKSLKRFGCIHKSWALLLENPYFMSRYRKNFISENHSYDDDDTSLLLHMDVRYTFQRVLYSLSGERFENKLKLDWPNPFKEDNYGFNILGSSSINGIFCLCKHIPPNKGIVLWNPATMEFKVVPLVLANTFRYRFGYDPIKDDYKVIRHVFKNELWEIYSLRSNSWRKLDVHMQTRTVFEYVEVYMDGVCHWWGIGVPHDEEYLLSFDFRNDTLVTTPKPSYMDFSDNMLESRQLVLLNESIALMVNFKRETVFHISILGELGVKESWTKIFIIGPLHGIDYPIAGAGKKGEIFFRRNDKKLVCFNLITQSIDDLDVGGMHDCSKILTYKKSLLPIGGITN